MFTRSAVSWSGSVRQQTLCVTCQALGDRVQAAQ
jgi:hypothetical protein